LVGQILGLDVQVGEIKIPLLPWGIIEDKEDLECLDLTVFKPPFCDMALSLTET
jgi:hypothetical protein